MVPDLLRSKVNSAPTTKQERCHEVFVRISEVAYTDGLT